MPICIFGLPFFIEYEDKIEILGKMNNLTKNFNNISPKMSHLPTLNTFVMGVIKTVKATVKVHQSITCIQ